MLTSQEHCLGNNHGRRGKGHEFKSRPGLQPHRPALMPLATGTRCMTQLITPSRHLSHLSNSGPRSLLPNQAPPAHRNLNELLKLLLERQQFPIQVRAVGTVRIVRILSTMVLPRSHRPTATLTGNCKRQDLVSPTRTQTIASSNNNILTEVPLAMVTIS